jgi:hypothetical protein
LFEEKRLQGICLRNKHPEDKFRSIYRPVVSGATRSVENISMMSDIQYICTSYARSRVPAHLYLHSTFHLAQTHGSESRFLEGTKDAAIYFSYFLSLSFGSS